MDTVTITFDQRSYQINNPGAGRIGSKLAMGIPYEHKLLHHIYRLGLTGSAFDVGAHIGNHSLWFAAICGLKVYAWEPFADSLFQLQANIALNDLDITVFDWAAGDRDTTGRFTPGMWVEFDPTREGDKLHLDRGTVPVHPIDAKLNVDDLALVKVDVEGMEHHVLGGLTEHLTKNDPVVYAETHTRTAQAKTAAVLEPLGYRVRQTIQMGSPMVEWVR